MYLQIIQVVRTPRPLDRPLCPEMIWYTTIGRLGVFDLQCRHASETLMQGSFEGDESFVLSIPQSLMKLSRRAKFARRPVQ